MKINILLLFFIYPLVSFCQNISDTIDKQILIDEVVISADKTEGNRKNISQQIQSINSKQIGFQNYSNTADILEKSGTLNVQKSQQGGGSPVVRGFEAGRILLMVDGVRMNNLIFRAGHLQNILSIDENSLEMVEVLYGPSSVMYGSDALGGAICMYTKNPEIRSISLKQFKVNALLRYGSVNMENKAHVDASFSGEKWGSYTSFTYSRFGDLRMGSRPNGKNAFFGSRKIYTERVDNKDVITQNEDSLIQKGSYYSQFDIVQKIVFQPSSNNRHLLNIQYSGSSDIPRYDRLTESKGEGLKFAQWYYGPQQRLLVGYNLYSNNLLPGRDVHFGLHYQQFRESRHQRKFGNDELQNRIENVKVLNFNLDLKKSIGSNQLHYGFDAETDFLKSSANDENLSNGIIGPLDTRYPNGKNRMSQMGVYATLNHSFNHLLNWKSGLRIGYATLFSRHDDTLFFSLPYSTVNQKNITYSGNTGLVFNKNQNLKLSMNISTGFRVPNIDDLSKIFESVGNKLIVPNEHLRPEKTVTTDLGISFGKEGMFWIENTLYHTVFFDAIVVSDFQFSGKDSVLYDGSMCKTYAGQNLQKAYILGYSGSLKLIVHGNILVYSTLNYTRDRIYSSGDVVPLDHIPPLFGIIGASFKKQKLYFDLNILFNGEKNIDDYYLNGEDNEQYAPKKGTPSWQIFNLKCSYQINRYITIQSGIENILDIQYRTFASGINAAGRNIYVALRMKL